ncbi:hypothetical protein DDT91_20395 [Algoriphagus sp. AK58]|nr:hypothetical protein [Algoriphagus sp. AK58]
MDPKKVRLSPASFVRTGLDQKIIRTLGEYGQNLAAAPNELAIANVIALVISEVQQKPAPEAYMGYALYDADSNLYEQGKVILSKKARNKHEELIQKLAIKKDGYIETYLVNETSENVWFDQFRIMSTGPLIVQETHYDPWGVDLSGLGYQYGGIKVNPYLYNGKELTSGLGVIMYDYGARFYIPAIGRWFVHDPLAEKARRQSPYNYALNNPMRFIDPDGMEAYSVMGEVKQGEPEAEDSTEKSVVNGEETNPDSEDVWVEMGYGKVLSSEVMGADYIGNFETVGGNGKSTNQNCCGDNNKAPNEIERKNGRGYGYTGTSESRNGQVWYQMSDQRGKFFWVDKNWNGRNGSSMIDYMPGGRKFGETDMGKSKLGIYIREHLMNHLDNILWLWGPKMPPGTMPGQPYFGPGLPLENPSSGKTKIKL